MAVPTFRGAWLLVAAAAAFVGACSLEHQPITPRADAADIAIDIARDDGPVDADAADVDVTPPCADGGMRCDGACTDTQTDPANCGMCGMACPMRANAAATCAAGRCGIACNAGFADCDGDAANGCEADLSSAATCGNCMTRCADPTPLCGVRMGDGGAGDGGAGDGGAGARACTSNCDNPMAPDRCGMACVNLQTDPANCMACGTACPPRANAAATCAAGACGFACNAGFADCNAMAADGCETPTNTTMNCGACGVACPARANATTACTGGVCGFTCNAGFGNCDGNAANGCETELATAVAHCGMCGRACATPANAAPTCAAGTCGFTCLPNFANCDGNAANGCEVDLRSNAANCGMCGRACSAGQVCSAMLCGCAPPLSNCGGACVDTQTNTAHCGVCNNACPTRPNTTMTHCLMGSCGFTCAAGFGNCDGALANGCETNLLTTNAHCGLCGRVCGAGLVCQAGVCAACPVGRTPCNGMCVDVATDESHCGACNQPCGALPNAVPTCMTSRCTLVCQPGFANCDGGEVNGCETNTNTSMTNCGMCGRMCTGGQRCMSGTCS